MRHPGGDERPVRLAGTALLDVLRLEVPYRTRVDSLRRIIDLLDAEVTGLDGQIADALAGDAGHHAV
ncbi:hypothetical protein AB8O64_35730 (plasmid) [Streptomyces sp. QH1-20]|uniref:hypothetical protein n=1 Tax=Streptomyces sp. QH1-20 TaxID=3240934 RepID=UPI00351400C1